VKPAWIFFAVLACAYVAGCASSYRAPVVERAVGRPSAARPAPPPAEQRPESYTVKRGDTLYSIALDNGLDYRDLAAWNNITDPAAIKAGLVLRMRPPGPVAQPEVGTQVQPEARVQAAGDRTGPGGSIALGGIHGQARSRVRERSRPGPAAVFSRPAPKR
jgi:lipoprotein NlpD